MSKQIQDSILDAINIIVTEQMNNLKYTSSNTALVKSVNDTRTSCIVEYHEKEVECILMEHLQDWIQRGDIVMIQDFFNDNTKKAVIGKVGTIREDNVSFSVYDTDIQKTVSGVEQLYDTDIQMEVETDLEID